MANLLQRAQLALNTFRQQPTLLLPPGAGESDLRSIRARQANSTPMLWPRQLNGRPQWTMIDIQAYSEQGFNANSIIYSAIMYKVRALSQVPLRAYTGNREKPELIEDVNHPLVKLCTRPNPHQSYLEFQGQNTVYLNVAGNVYMLIVRDTSGNPIALYSLRPDRVYIVPNENALLGYLYRPENIDWDKALPILPEDMIHVKLPVSPSDPLEGFGYGLSPIAALARNADVDNSINVFLKTFFDSGPWFSGLLKFPQELDDDVIAGVQERWAEMYGGARNWGREIGVLDNGAEYQQISAPFDTLGFSTLDERDETRIHGPFGVPPILTGSRVGLMRSTYSNYEQARQAFWEDTAKYEIALYDVEYGSRLTMGDAFAACDLSDVEAFKPNTLAMINAAKALWDMGTPANVALSYVGLEIEEIPGGDVGYIAAGLMPSGAQPDFTPEQTPDQPPPEPITAPRKRRFDSLKKN